jgi:parvulin-like peptidyl-prolyl isomerase
MMGSVLWRSPAARFLVLGGALWLARDLVVPEPPPAIVLDAAAQARLRRAWTAAHGAPADPAGAAAMLEAAIDDEVLYREAVARGLDRTQPIVRDRVARLAAFVDGGPIEDEHALAETAEALDLTRRDLVVRRHLVRTMRLALGHLEPSDLPDEAALAEWYARHADDFREPPRVRFTHVYLRRGESDAAPALLARLRREATAPQDAVALGRPVPQGATFGPSAESAVAGVFGDAFAHAVATLPEGTWSEPVTSPYGVHLVWVAERLPGRVPPLDAVRGRVVHAVVAERRAARTRERLAALRARYAVRVEPDATPGS